MFTYPYFRYMQYIQAEDQQDRWVALVRKDRKERNMMMWGFVAALITVIVVAMLMCVQQQNSFQTQVRYTDTSAHPPRAHSNTRTT